MVTSGKVYEYVATGLPIASVLDPSHDAQRVLSGYPRWYPAAREDAASLAAALVAAAQDSASHTDSAGRVRRRLRRAVPPRPHARAGAARAGRGTAGARMSHSVGRATGHPGTRRPAPAGELVLLSTGAAPSAMQVRHLLRAARGRPILWVAYARDLGVEFGWRLREVRPLDAQTAVEELAHGDDDGSDGLLELMDPWTPAARTSAPTTAPDRRRRRRPTGDAAAQPRRPRGPPVPRRCRVEPPDRAGGAAPCRPRPLGRRAGPDHPGDRRDQGAGGGQADRQAGGQAGQARRVGAPAAVAGQRCRRSCSAAPVGAARSRASGSPTRWPSGRCAGGCRSCSSPATGPRRRPAGTWPAGSRR